VRGHGGGSIRRQRWRAGVIRRAVRTVLADLGYRRHAEALAGAMRTMDGAGTAAERMWEFLLKL
jgi:UDP:flavonoid glycosyltransferase YjiC (YdhE family)